MDNLNVEQDSIMCLSNPLEFHMDGSINWQLIEEYVEFSEVDKQRIDTAVLTRAKEPKTYIDVLSFYLQVEAIYSLTGSSDTRNKVEDCVNSYLNTAKALMKKGNGSLFDKLQIQFLDFFIGRSKSIVDTISIYLKSQNLNTVLDLLVMNTPIYELDGEISNNNRKILKGLFELIRYRFLDQDLTTDLYLDYVVECFNAGYSWPERDIDLKRMGFLPQEIIKIKCLLRGINRMQSSSRIKNADKIIIKNGEISLIEIFRHYVHKYTDVASRKMLLYINAYDKKHTMDFDMSTIQLLRQEIIELQSQINQIQANIDEKQAIINQMLQNGNIPEVKK